MSPTAQLSTEDGYATVRLTGELDLATRSLMACVAQWPTTPSGDRPGLVVDLTGVDFVDVGSVRQLATLVDHVGAVPAVVICTPGIVPKALQMTGFSRRVRVVEVMLLAGQRLSDAEVRLLMRRPFPA